MECELCHNQEFKYQCPRCNIKYCSLPCYRSAAHSQCSEAFYKECVVSELSSQQCDPEQRRKVVEMLQRVEQQEEEEVQMGEEEEVQMGEEEEEEWEDLDSDDEESETELAQRLREVDLNNADQIWERLTDAEREEFKSIVHSGNIDGMVKPVEPYWRQKISDLVIEIDECTKRIEEIRNSCPPVMSDIKNFRQIASKPPARCVIYNIANVIASYSYIFHLYNGDHSDHELEAANNFIVICDNLKKNANFEDVSSVIESIALNCHNNSLHADSETKTLLHEDLMNIFAGPYDDDHSNMFLLACISDLIRLLNRARSTWKETKPSKKTSSKGFSSHFPSDKASRKSYNELKNQTHVLGCVKKLEFYLSFIKHCYNRRDWNIEA